MMSYTKQVFRIGLVLLSLAAVLCVTLLPAGAMAQPDTAPDLVIESITWVPENPVIGNTVTFQATIKNQGNGQSAACEVGYYIDDTSLHQVPIGQLDAGNSVTDTFTWKATAGEHIIRGLVDRLNTVAESNEENNDKSYALSVLASDLIVQSLSWTPEIPSAGDTVAFTVCVENQGSYRAGVSNVGLYIDGITRGHREVGMIEPGNTVTTTFSWQAKPGSHTIRAVADKLNQISESDETNNELSADYSSAAPDLVADNITWTPEDITAYDIVDFSFVVRNQGTGSSYTSRLLFYIDDFLETSILIGPLSPAGSDNKTYRWIANKRPQTFRLVIDADGENDETNEDNNEFVMAMPDIHPDLIIEDITWLPDPPLLTHKVEFTVTVKNQGTAQSASTSVNLYVNELYPFQSQTGTIDVDATQSVIFSWVTQAEVVNLRAVVDEDNYVTEIDETNNTRKETVGFSPPTPTADLTIQSITCTPTSPSIGDTVTVSVQIINIGTGGTSPSHVKYMIDGVAMDDIYTESIAAGASVTKTYTWVSQAGTHDIDVIIDSNNAVDEADETNNEGSISVSVLAPDLYIQGITWSPSNPSTRDTVNAAITITNLGDDTAGDSYITYYLDGVYRGNHYVEDIAPGAEVTKSFSWQAESDKQVFRAVIDEDDTIAESNEANNTRDLAFPAPDLIIEKFEWSPESPTENTTVTLRVTIKNQGSGKSGSTIITGYVNDTLLATLDIEDISPGNSVTGTFTFMAASGEQVLKAVVDEGNGVIEISETNNEQMATLSVPITLSDTPDTSTGDDSGSPAGDSTPDDETDGQPSSDTPGTGGEEGTEPGDAEDNVPSKPWYEAILTNYMYVLGLVILCIVAIILILILKKRSNRL
jgi:subtilase family serine protease